MQAFGDDPPTIQKLEISPWITANERQVTDKSMNRGSLCAVDVKDYEGNGLGMMSFHPGKVS